MAGTNDAAREEERLRAFGERMKAERLEAGYATQEDLAESTGISIKTIGNIERGVDLEQTEHTKRTIEKAFHWGRGSYDAVRAGGQPTPEPEPVISRAEINDMAYVWSALRNVDPEELRAVREFLERTMAERNPEA